MVDRIELIRDLLSVYFYCTELAMENCLSCNKKQPLTQFFFTEKLLAAFIKNTVSVLFCIPLLSSEME